MGKTISLCNQKSPSRNNLLPSTNLLVMPDGSQYQINKKLSTADSKVKTERAFAPGGKTVVIKRYPLREGAEVDIDSIEQAINIANSWQHNHLVQYHSVSFDRGLNELIIISDYNANTFEEFYKLTTPAQVKQILSGLIQTLQFLIAEKKIAQVNLKKSNLLAKPNGTVVLRDYLLNGYLEYLVLGKNATRGNDGLFQQTNELDKLMEIIKGFYRFDERGVPLEIRNLKPLMTLLDKEKDKRPEDIDWEAILSHPFFIEKDTPRTNHDKKINTEPGNFAPDFKIPPANTMHSQMERKMVNLNQSVKTPDTAIMLAKLADRIDQNTYNPTAEMRNWIHQSLHQNIQGPNSQSSRGSSQSKKVDVPTAPIDINLRAEEDILKQMQAFF
jgi:hypothetical protein